MSKYSTIIMFVMISMTVIFVMSTALSWVVYVVWLASFGSAPPFWMFWSGCSMIFIASCFASTIRKY